MKLPIIRQFYQNQTPENLEATLEVLESFSEIRIAKLPPLNQADIRNPLRYLLITE